MAANANAGQAVRSQGAILKVEDPAVPGSATVLVGCPTSIGTSGSSNSVDVSCLGSTARSYVAGLAESGEISLSLILTTNDAGQKILREAYTSGAVLKYELELSDGMKLEFSAVVTAFSLSLGVDEAATLDVTLQISGDITWTDAPDAP